MVTTSPHLELRGPPRRISARSGRLPEPGLYTVAVAGPAGEALLTIDAEVVRRRDDQRQMRLRLPMDTAPGEYLATLEQGGVEHRALIIVEGVERITARPVETVFVGAPGATAEAQLLLSNAGNVAVTIPRTVVLGAFDDNGLEDAIASAYRQQTDDGLKIFGHFVLKLREGYAGLLKCRVTEGSGRLAPFSQRWISLRVELPSKLKLRHHYHGIWEFGTLFQRVVIQVTGPELTEGDVEAA